MCRSSFASGSSDLNGAEGKVEALTLYVLFRRHAITRGHALTALTSKGDSHFESNLPRFPHSGLPAVNSHSPAGSETPEIVRIHCKHNNIDGLGTDDDTYEGYTQLIKYAKKSERRSDSGKGQIKWFLRLFPMARLTLRLFSKTRRSLEGVFTGINVSTSLKCPFCVDNYYIVLMRVFLYLL